MLQIMIVIGLELLFILVREIYLIIVIHMDHLYIISRGILG